MGTRLKPQATTPGGSFSAYGQPLSPNPLEPVRAGAGEVIGSAAYTIQGLNINGDLNYTPQVAGVRIRHLGGISMALAVTVAGSDITVQLATDGSGNVTSTATAVKTAYDAVAAAVALAVVQVGGTGAGLAGVFSSFMPLTDDAFGSIRPSIQTMMNNDSFMYSKVYGILNGTVDPAFPSVNNQRSLKALYVDGIGDQVVTATAGEVFATSANQVGISGLLNSRQEPQRFCFKDVGAIGTTGNPTNTVALKNEIRPSLTCKAWGRVVTDNAGNFVSVSGNNFTPSFSGGDIQITFASPMDHNTYAHLANYGASTAFGLLSPHAFAHSPSINSFLITVQNAGVTVNCSTTAVIVVFQVFAYQVG